MAKRSRFTLAAIVAAIAIGATLTADAADPDPMWLFSQQHLVMGGPAWDRIGEIIEHGTFEGQGLSGAYVTFVDPHHGFNKTLLQVGGTVRGQGYDKQGSWTLQGSVVTPLDDPSSIATARTNAYIARGGWWQPGADSATMTSRSNWACGDRRCDVVRVVPQGCNQIDVFLDEQTHLLTQTIQRDLSNAEITTTYYAYRSIEGVEYPFATQTSSGDPRYDRRTVVDSVSFAPKLAEPDVTRP